MKFTKQGKVTLLTITVLLLGACAIQKKTTIRRVTSEDVRILKYLDEKKISYCRLEDTFNSPTNNSSVDSKCMTTCCEDLNFCGITKGEVIKYIRNYRDENWMRSSPFIQDRSAHITRSNITTVMRDIYDGTYLDPLGLVPDPGSDPGSFDARFMDIPVDELENYLCHLKRNSETAKAKVCRFYYMKYDKDPALGDKSDKHTLAIVPVQMEEKNGAWVTKKECTEVYEWGKGTPSSSAIYVIGSKQCNKSGMLNHSKLCPPYTTCIDKTLIKAAD